MTGRDELDLEAIEKLGIKIIRCPEKCKGIIKDQENGYYPRSFFLDPENASQVKAVVVGKSPGNSGFLEREFYKFAAERNNDKQVTYNECVRIWRAISAGADYYLRPRHLLEELGILRKGSLDLNGILWTEIAYCEKDPVTKRIPKDTFDKCSTRFLKRIFELLPGNRHVVCLGGTAFHYVKRIPNISRMKVINVYHPTGARLFANYFVKEKGKRITERRLKEKLIDEFRDLDMKQSYICKFRPDRVKQESFKTPQRALLGADRSATW